MDQPTSNDSELLTSEANILGFLARLWIAEPDSALLSTLAEPELATQFFGEIDPGDRPQLDVDALASEYCSCFLGPQGHLPPYQSVVLQSRFQGDCLSSLNQFIEVVGVPEGPHFNEEKMRDHAGMLLGMMQRIDLAEMESNPGENHDFQLLKKTFFIMHLKWIPEYCQVASTRTSSSFYRSLFQLTRDFLLELESGLGLTE